MGKKKYRKSEWHHRVPDFKLVYCGTKYYKQIVKKESTKTENIIFSKHEESEKINKKLKTEQVIFAT